MVSTIYDSSLNANCGGTLLCRHAVPTPLVGMHVFHVLVALSVDLSSCCDISLGTPLWKLAVATSMLTCVGVGDPIPSVMGNHCMIEM